MRGPPSCLLTVWGACDSIARGAMLLGLVDMPDGEELIPFVRLFYQSPSQYWWRDAMGEM